MSVICTNIVMRVVVVKVAVDRSRRIACRRSKNAVNLSVCALLSLRLRRYPCRRFYMQDHVYPFSCVSLPPIVCGSSGKCAAATGVAGGVQGENRCSIYPYPPVAAAGVSGGVGGKDRSCICLYPPVTAASICRRGARGKSLQHLPVSARYRGRRCRRGARGKSVVHMSVFAYRRGMCLSGAAEEKRTAFVSRRFCLQILRGHKSLLCIKYLSPSVSPQTIEIGHRSFGLHKMPAAAGIGANDTRRL